MPMSSSDIVAYSERESIDLITGADGVLRKEWRIRPLTELLLSTLVEAFGPDWQRYSPGAEWILEVRYIRRGTDEGWKPFQTLNERSMAWGYIDSPAVAVDPEMIAWEAARRAAETAAVQAAAEERARRAEVEADARGRKASEAAFDRMRSGSAAGAALADAWNAWVQAHSSDDKAMWTSNAEFMELYAVVMWSTTVPAKRKAIRALLGLYGREFLP